MEAEQDAATYAAAAVAVVVTAEIHSDLITGEAINCLGDQNVLQETCQLG